MRSRFPGRRGDDRWGRNSYPVTASQKRTCEALAPVLLNGKGYFCSQKPFSGIITMGFDNKSVDIDRSGRVLPNHSTSRIEYA